MSKVGVHIIGGVLVIPLTRGTNPCIGLAVSQDPRAPRVWGSMVAATRIPPGQRQGTSAVWLDPHASAPRE